MYVVEFYMFDDLVCKLVSGIMVSGICFATYGALGLSN